MARRKVCLLVEYDGTPYRGWQRQAGLPTVQGALEAALARVLGEVPTGLICAGRTDAGVHAAGQVVTFWTAYPAQTRRLVPALNHVLPPTLRVHRAEDVAESFDARQSARGKHYAYQIYLGPQPPAIGRERAWHLRCALDVMAMQAAADALVGEHDFESFRSAHCDAAHARRHLTRLVLRVRRRPPVGQTCTVHLHANAFCRHMCRILVGTLVEVGRGRRPPASMAAILAARSRTAAGMTAPPCGLTLVEVFYPPPARPVERRDTPA